MLHIHEDEFRWIIFTHQLTSNVVHTYTHTHILHTLYNTIQIHKKLSLKMQVVN